jgi:hypothetical protein
MRIYNSVLIIVLLLGSIVFGAGSSPFFHLTPQGVVKGEEVNFEVMLSPENSKIYDIYLFYRQLGEADYRTAKMDRVGYLYSLTMLTDAFVTGQIEYYFGYEAELGEIGTMPDISPQTNPFVMRISPNNAPSEQQGSVEVIVLSPEPNEMVRFDELLISASVMGLEDNFDFSKSQLLIDGTNVTSLAEIRDGVFTFSPKQIKSGYHNIELVIRDEMNNEIGRQEWSFRATGGQDTQTGKGSYYKGSVFVENRHTNIGTNSQNYFRGGGRVNGSVNNLHYNARLIFSTEEESNRQPVNRYAAELMYKFSERNNIYVKGGDFTPYYNPLAFQNKRVRGVDAGLAFGFFTFDFVYGQLYRGIEGTFATSEINTITQNPANPGVPVDTTIIDTLQGLGKYEENIMAFRPGFRFGDNVHWNLNLINSREQKGSINYGGALREAIVVGTDLSMNFDNKRILFDASFQTSINNSNAGLEEIEYDTLAKINEDLADNSTARSLWDFLRGTGMISMTPGLNPYPSLAMRFETGLNYFGNNLVARFTKVDRNFASPGNPYMLKDNTGFYIGDNVRLFTNQVFLNLFYRGFTTNQSQGNQKTSNNELGVTFSYFPRQNLPSLSVSYITIGRSNNVTPNDTLDFSSPELYMEDNSTQTINVATSYNFDVTNLRNTVSLNFSNYSRDEALEIKQINQSNFMVFGVGLMTKFQFPLITKIDFSQSNSAFGAGVFESTTDIQRIFIGLEYRMENLIEVDQFRPFANLVFQNVKFSGGEDTKRNNYTLGLLYRSPQLGVLSVRYDSISYGTVVEYTDSILNARYQYNF